MGTLGAPFILCPLSDRKELLGMAEDRLQNKVILTIGKNIAIRYHTQEQKQETSWTMSRHWLTSHVVFCTELQKYGAVLDNNTLALWEEEDTALDNVSKVKFTEPIARLHPTKTRGTLLIFENGFVVQVQQALHIEDKKKRKHLASGKGLFDPTQRILVDFSVCEQSGQVVLLTADKKSGRQIQKRKCLKAHVLSATNELLCEVEVKGEISGHCILHLQDCPPCLLYLDEDGRLLQQELSASCASPVAVGFLGKCVSAKTPVVLCPIEDSSTLVVYGSDPSEEGAVVFLYDTKYDLVVSKQGLKMYGTPPIMERLGGNIIIPVGLHVLVVALRTSKSLLSGVVGKHGIRGGEEVFEQRVPFPKGLCGWEVDNEGEIQDKKAQKKKPPRPEKETARDLEEVRKAFPKIWQVVRQTKILEKEGQPQSLICNQIVPMVLNREKHKELAVEWVLQALTDIPELHLVSILAFLLQFLPPPTTPPYDTTHEKRDYYASNSLIENVLVREVDHRELERSLSTLTFESGLVLAKYLKCRMECILHNTTTPISSREEGGTEGWDEMGYTVRWLLSLLDAHYTRFVLSSQVELVEEVLEVVERGMGWMDHVSELEPYLLFTRNKVDHRPRPNPKNKWRSEVLEFYAG